MPHKNPRCPKCNARTKFFSSDSPIQGKVWYICKYRKHGCEYGCGYTFLDWEWKQRPKKEPKK